MTMMILLNRCLGLRQQKPILARKLTVVGANFTYCINMRKIDPLYDGDGVIVAAHHSLIALVSCWCKQERN